MRDSSPDAVITESNSKAPGHDELEGAADAILEAAGALSGRNGIYTKSRLERKIRNDHRRAPRVSECEVPQDVIQYLLERQIDDLVEASGLTALQEIVFRLYAGGLTCRDMEATLGIKHRAIATRLRAARRKVRAAYNQGRYAGWYEVYLSEVRRGRRR